MTMVCRFLIVTVGVAFVSCAPRPSPVAPPSEPSALVLRTMGGAKVTLASYRGTVVLVDVWATWCEPCEHSLPFYAGLRSALSPRGFEVLAISVDESEADVRLFLGRHPLPFPVFHDPGGEVAGRLGAPGMPTCFLIDRDGKIRWRHDGFASGDEALLRSRVTALLDERE